MKEKIIAAAEKHKQLILDAERYIWKNPESGYREWKTHKYLTEKYRELGYTLVEATNIPGFYTDIDTGREGPTVMILGEMDSLIIPDHPECDKETGAVHACGHHAQSAALLGVAAILKEPGMLDGLCGKIRLCAVPAEEGIELEYRKVLKKQGIISQVSGKAEFICRGWCDDVDMAFIVHTTTGEAGRISCTGEGSNGAISKTVEYKGVSSHAGGSPWAGINALYAANLGLSAINALRETFRDTDKVRVHPIITNGGAVVNAIPETVKVESYVRALTVEAMERENKKVNRAIAASAAAMGARVTISDEMAFAPNRNNLKLRQAVRAAGNIILGEENTAAEGSGYGSSSTDMGHLSCIMPTVHPSMSGAGGRAHSPTYTILDPYSACVQSAEFQVMMVRVLLEEDARFAKDVLRDYTPPFTKQEYKDYLGKASCEFDAVQYNDDGSITIKV
ncbi:MAG: amidohydrolase [Clostridia bacterium]|nr:amidohydrolase [Clostridia bacterium]